MMVGKIYFLKESVGGMSYENMFFKKNMQV